MTQADKARRELDALLMEHAQPVAELTAVLCEDGATCMVMVELADSTLLGRSFDWPPNLAFSEADVLAELQRLDPSRCVHSLFGCWDFRCPVWAIWHPVCPDRPQADDEPLHGEI